MSGLITDVVMPVGHQICEFDFTATNLGVTLFRCHQHLHMDCGFMTLFRYT
jgi:FtsP/CotA-like multicopper oxidase with cupredoxin domain